MHILGIDPGSRFAGWGIIKVDGRKLVYLASGCINLSGIDNFFERTGPLFNAMKELCHHYKIDEVALESLIHVKNVSSLSKLAQARGVILSALFSCGVKLPIEYSPNLIKSSVSGNGHADKESIAKSVQYILGKKEYGSADETDALAIAICHALNRNTLKNVSSTKGKIMRGSLQSSLAHKIPGNQP
jgi:crossover junction endodeoxyribonuclease RuvC